MTRPDRAILNKAFLAGYAAYDNAYGEGADRAFGRWYTALLDAEDGSVKTFVCDECGEPIPVGPKLITYHAECDAEDGSAAALRAKGQALLTQAEQRACEATRPDEKNYWNIRHRAIYDVLALLDAEDGSAAQHAMAERTWAAERQAFAAGLQRGINSVNKFGESDAGSAAEEYAEWAADQIRAQTTEEQP